MILDTRGQSIVRRWVAILILASFIVIGGASLLSLLPSTRGVMQDNISTVRPWLCAGVAVLASALAFAVVLKVWPISFGHFCFMHLYPPTWLAVALGAALVCLLDLSGAIATERSILAWWEWLIVLGVAIGAVLVRASFQWASSPPKESEKSEAGAASPPQPGDNLDPWLRVEGRSNEDFLNRRYVARRVADQLLAPFGKDRTLGLAGPFGSGKSSIVGWIQPEADRLRKKDEPLVWVCEVSCWGFEDTSAAVHHILSSTLKEINKRADTFSIRHLPESYRKALATGGGGWSSLIDLLFGTPDPMEQLRKITPILESLNARLVLIVEDLDRNQSTKFDPQEVLAVLHRMRDIRGISFVLTGGSTASSKIDFAKLCDHIEPVPRMSRAAVLDLIRRVRKRCIEAYKDINPEDWGRHPDEPVTIWEGREVDDDILEYFGIDMSSPVSTALSLLSTPRVVKHALRHTVDAWEKLHGEVAFDELLMSNVLRFGAPEAFNFLLRRVGRLRSSQSRDKHEKEAVERRKQSIEEEWRVATKDAEWDTRSGIELIAFLLPQSARYLANREPRGRDSPQGVQHPSPTDYWSRIVVGELTPGEVTDQEVLRAMDEWLQTPTPDKTLVCRLADDEPFTKVWDHFSARIQRQSALFQLADQVIERLLSKLGSAASENNGGIHALRRRAERNGYSQENMAWLERKIREVMPRSLQLSVDLHLSWGTIDGNFLQGPEVEQLHNRVFEAARGIFSQNPQALVNALSAECPHAVYQLVFPPVHRGKVAQTPKDWRWFTDTLTQAVSLDVAKMMPKLVSVMIRDTEIERGVRLPAIPTDLVNEIFDNPRAAVEQLTQPVPTGDKRTERYFQLVKEKAVEWLAQNTAPQAVVAAPGDPEGG